MKPKIPKLTKKERRMWIKALKELLDWYKKKKKLRYGCPLCTILPKGLCIRSHHCVWYWFTGYSCNSFTAIENFDFDAYELNKSRNPRWVKLRLRQIPRWIKKLEEGL
jgi:hypothetical protein